MEEPHETQPGDDPLDPTTFVGFSEDEARFAYSVFSRGASIHLFTVIDSSTGRRLTDMALGDEETKTLARQLLEEGGFSSSAARGADLLGSDASLLLKAEPGEVRIEVLRGETRASLDIPTALDSLAGRLRSPRIELWGFSPKGNYLAVHITDDHGPMLGEAETYQVVKLDGLRVRDP